MTNCQSIRHIDRLGSREQYCPNQSNSGNNAKECSIRVRFSKNSIAIIANWNFPSLAPVSSRNCIFDSTYVTVLSARRGRGYKADRLAFARLLSSPRLSRIITIVVIIIIIIEFLSIFQADGSSIHFGLHCLTEHFTIWEPQNTS